VKLPPAKTLPADTAMSSTPPPGGNCESDELTALQLLPFHVAIRSAAGMPPASLKSPPT
jgi:hypothetical protein